METFPLDVDDAGAEDLKRVVRDKLLQLERRHGVEILVEYVVALVGYGKHQAQLVTAFEAFLGKQSPAFVAWLWDHLSVNYKAYTSVASGTLPFRQNHHIWTILAAKGHQYPEIDHVSMCFIKDFVDENVVLKIIQQFIISVASTITAGCQPERSLKETSFSHLPNASLMFTGLNTIVDAGLLPHWANENSNVVPLLVATASFVLFDARRTDHRLMIKQVFCLLRSLGMKYREPLLEMMTSTKRLHSGSTIAAYYKGNFMNNEVNTVLHELSEESMLDSLSVAFEGFRQSPLPEECVKQKICYVEIDVLKHIVQMLKIPEEFVVTYLDKDTASHIESFHHRANALFKITDALLYDKIFIAQEESEVYKLAKEILLCCASFAHSPDRNSKSRVIWSTAELNEIANTTATLLSLALQDYSKAVKPSNSSHYSSDLECFVSKLLRDILPELQATIKASNVTFDYENTKKLTSNSGSNPIICAHQMSWLIKQIRYPHLGSCCELIMPCMLTALDHPTPTIKEQAMLTFLHAADNMDPSEMRWFKDVILDAVNHSIIGSEELWPVAVKMAVKLLTCMEGRNSRGQWYRTIFDQMIGELQRHSSDQDRCITWFQNIDPQLQAMGLLLAAHFKQLLPLFFYWLHTFKPATILMVLSCLQAIVRYTWPRMPFHAQRILRELHLTYKKWQTSKSGVEIRSSIAETCRLLLLCGGPGAQSAWIEIQDDPSVALLVYEVDKK